MRSLGKIYLQEILAFPVRSKERRFQSCRMLRKDLKGMAEKNSINILSIAKGSCAELRSQLYVALDIGYVTQAEFEELISLAEEVGRILGGLRASVARQTKTK